jgi:Ca-activated chloride channel family protein
MKTVSRSWMLWRRVAAFWAVLVAAGWPLESQAPIPVSPVPNEQQQNPSQKADIPAAPVINAPPAAALAPPPPSNAGKEFTISAEVDLVLLDVSVRDSDGGYVSGLPKEAFTVLEDGKPQTITQFADNDIPVTVGLVVDNSGSMRPKKPDVITAALVFIQSSNPLDEWFVINFNDRVRRGLPDILPFTDDVTKLRAALAKTDPVGRTALYDAVLAGLRQLEMGRRDKKTLVVISDGGDNASTHNFKDVWRAVLESQATIYTVGIFDQNDKESNPDVLKRLAHVSGGVCYLPKQLDEVVGICRQIAKDIRTRYTIGYVPQQLNRTGVRHIKVEVHAPGHEKLIARTRTSYMVTGPAGATDRQKESLKP